MDESRETGRVKDWRDKGFGFIERDQGGSLFCHARETPGRLGLTPGSRVSFLFEADDKTGKATQVQVEEAAEEDNSPREMGTIKRWNADTGFGFVGRAQGGDDAFVHKKECGGKDLAVGQYVSFVFEEGAKGASAKNVKEEECGEAVVVLEEDEGEREFGKVKSYTEDKGFAFIGRCTGGDDLFAHKKEFGGIEPVPGMPVSFIVESTEKGDAAKNIRQEDSVPDIILSDEGRDFGTIKTFIADKGYGFIVRKKGGDNARFFDRQCDGFIPESGKVVSFVLEETDKGPSAKDLREEDPERVKRVTAKVYYGRVDEYFDPTEKRPTNGYGFIKPFDPPSYGAPKRYYFHMSEIQTPDEDGGIEPDTNVSFIVIAARKGVQAAAVTMAERPKENEDENEATLEESFGGIEVKDHGNGDTGEGEAAAEDGWGAWGD